jgi:hypothetical protein
MNTTHTQSDRRLSLSNDFVSSDFMALASHMTDCQRSRGRFFILRTRLESLHALTASRLVTTGAALTLCSLALVALGFLTMA